MTTEIAIGSLRDIATKSGQSLAESFMSCDCIILIDVSGSMSSEDNCGISRYRRACEALRNLQLTMQGKIAVVAFSHDVKFEPAGIPFFTSGGTDLAKALIFVQIADQIPGMRFIVISDGQPDNDLAALKIAKRFKNKIDVIFVGDECDSRAITFMNELARASGGKQVTADSALISENVRYLLHN